MANISHMNLRLFVLLSVLKIITIMYQDAKETNQYNTIVNFWIRRSANKSHGQKKGHHSGITAGLKINYNVSRRKKN